MVILSLPMTMAELSKSLSCLSDNRSGRCGQCVRPIKHLLDLHFFYDFNWITHILAKSIKWFVYSFKWYHGVQHIFVWHVEIYIQYNRLVYEINKDFKVLPLISSIAIRSGPNQLDDWQPRPKLKLSLFHLSPTDP